MDPSNSSNNSRKGELTISGDGVFTSEDDVGFVVYKGYPYCEACHVRLRLPKCKRCGKSIRDHMEAVEALGGKWCWECFVCAVRIVSCSSFMPEADACLSRDVRDPSITRRSLKGKDTRFVSDVIVLYCGMSAHKMLWFLTDLVWCV